MTAVYVIVLLIVGFIVGFFVGKKNGQRTADAITSIRNTANKL
jgi:hypothetical protein